MGRAAAKSTADRPTSVNERLMRNVRYADKSVALSIDTPRSHSHSSRRVPRARSVDISARRPVTAASKPIVSPRHDSFFRHYASPRRDAAFTLGDAGIKRRIIIRGGRERSERPERSLRMIVVGERGISRTVADADGYALTVGGWEGSGMRESNVKGSDADGY